jgi:DNA-binding beta-propeller fold protein YncE
MNPSCRLRRMWKPFIAAASAVALLGTAAARAEDDSFVRDARGYVKAAQEARQGGRLAAAVDALLQAHALRPHHDGITFELAAALAAVGRIQDATESLRVVAATGLVLHSDGREEFRACRADAACADALAAIDRNRAPRVTSAVAFTFARPGLVPEGLAYDAATDAFFVSSARQRLILRLDKARRPQPFADRGQGLWAALGIAVDAPRRRLWVATAALAEMADATPADEGRSALVALDLASGRAVARYDLPRDRPHALGDVIVAPSGDVFTTDSVSPAVYRLPAGGTALEPVAAGEPFVSPQGLTLSADGTRLFVADYAKGVFAVDLASRRVRLVDAPRTASMLGIDGLYRVGNVLLGVQNGVDPPRLLRLRLDAAGDTFTAVDALDAGHPSATDPTLGVLAGGRFYYIGNSQWAAAKPGGLMDPAVKLEDPVILGLDLGPLATP